MSTKRCSKCSKPLVVNGVHMGVPFGRWTGFEGVDKPLPPMLVCARCYDEITVELTHKVVK